MNELIVITGNVIGDKEVNSVDARELWNILESKRDFSNWFKYKVLDNEFFIENEDYALLNNFVEAQPSTSQPASANRKDYALKVEAAKRVAMSEHTSKGEEVRTYFLKCEAIALGKEKKQKEIKDPTRLKIAQDFKANLQIAKLTGLTGNQAILAANCMMIKAYNVNLLEEAGVSLPSENNTQYFTPTVLGKQVALSAQGVNKKLEEAGMHEKIDLGKSKSGWKVTEKGMAYCQILDTGKRHSNGTPVQQTKWAASVLELVAA